MRQRAVGEAPGRKAFCEGEKQPLKRYSGRSAEFNLKDEQQFYTTSHKVFLLYGRIDSKTHFSFLLFLRF